MTKVKTGPNIFSQMEYGLDSPSALKRKIDTLAGTLVEKMNEELDTDKFKDMNSDMLRLVKEELEKDIKKAIDSAFSEYMKTKSHSLF